MKSEKTHTFVVYGLENCPDPEDIKKYLELKGIAIKNVYKMKNTRSTLYVVVTDNTTTLNDIETKAKTIELIVVRWQSLINTRHIVQYDKSQVWGHSATK
jgi:hypothetical protein